MIPVHWPLCYLLLYSTVVPLAQKPSVPNSNSYTTSWFKWSPNKHMFNYFELACFVYSVKWHFTPASHRLDKPYSYDTPQTADTLELTEPETPTLAEWRYSDGQASSPLPQKSPYSLLLLGGVLMLPSEALLLRSTSPLRQPCRSATLWSSLWNTVMGGT